MSDSVRPHGLWPARVLCPWDSPGKNTRVGCHALLQGIFPTQGSNQRLLGLTCIGRQFLYHQHHLGSPGLKVSSTFIPQWFCHLPQVTNFHKNSAPGKVLILLTEKGCFFFIGHGELHKYLSFPFCSSCQEVQEHIYS